MGERDIELEVYNTNGLTFLIRKTFPVPDANEIRVEVYNGNTLISSGVITSQMAGWKTYNHTKNMDIPWPTLRNKKIIKDGIINRHHLQVGRRLQCRFSILPGNIHLFKIYL